LDLARYARHIALPEIGPEGQARIVGARVVVVGSDLAAETATTYLRAAGVAHLFPLPAPAHAMVWRDILSNVDLVVRSGFDDDAMSATAISRGLTAEHDVVLSDAADAALGRILHGERFDAIICDLMMPVKTGVEFFADVSAQAPELAERIIFLTGGAFTVKAREFLDRVANPRLEKPFDLPALRALVNAQLR